MHIMWYESEMINETLDSLQAAIYNTDANIKLRICLNAQTYLESPISGQPDDMFNIFLNHPILKNAEIVYKTNSDAFYNVGDWRREVYSNEYKYIVWGESDTLIPYDYFYILENVNIQEPHVLSLSSRKMWDDTWTIVEHLYLQQLPCNEHDKIGIMSCGSYISYDQLIEFNNQIESIDIVKLPVVKIDGSLLALSPNLPTPFIAPDQHFYGEDTCAALFFQIKNIPQYHITTRIKGHNYGHPLKRTNTNNTRNDEVFTTYSQKSKTAMQLFLNELWKK